MFFKKARDPGEGATGADTGDKGVHVPFHLLPQLAGGGGVVEFRVGSIVELQCGKRAGGFRLQGAATPDGALHPLVFGGADHGGAEAPHQDAFLLGKAFGYKEDNLVAPMHAD